MGPVSNPNAPPEYTNEPLPTNHREHFKLMLRTLHITAGMNSTGGPQSTLNERPGSGPLVKRDVDGLELEAKPFETMAYGATLGLIYYRAIGPEARLQWDVAMEREVKAALNGHREGMEKRRQLAMDLAMNNSVLRQPAWLKSRADNSELIQNYARYADFLLTLREKKQCTFPTNDDDQLNKPEVIGRNPWCLGTKPEFTDAYKQVMGNPGTVTPTFYTGRPGERETLAQNATKMFGKAVEAKVIEYLGMFLEKASETALKGALRAGMNYVCKFPVVDSLVDWLKERAAKADLRDLREAYGLEMSRRETVYQLGWGIRPIVELDEISEDDRKTAAAAAR